MVKLSRDEFLLLSKEVTLLISRGAKNSTEIAETTGYPITIIDSVLSYLYKTKQIKVI